MLENKKVKLVTRIVNHLAMPTELARHSHHIDMGIISDLYDDCVDLPAVLLGDERRIRQVLINLV